MMLLSKASMSSLSSSTSSPTLTERPKSVHTKHSTHVSKQTAITAVSPTANQVVIIHQNTSNNGNATMAGHVHSTNQYLASDLFSSMSSSSSSSLGLAMNQGTSNLTNGHTLIQNDLDSFDFADAAGNNQSSITASQDVKYMKGYVNVIKERFARRSLCDKNSNNEQQQLQQQLSHNNNQGSAIRLSISDYQRRKQQTSGQSVANLNSNNSNNNKSRTASVDYQRTR